MDVVELNNGRSVPILGFGTWKLTSEMLGSKERFKDVLCTALEIGYRHFDSAALYGNEAELGEVLAEFIKDGRVKREELFITTKLPMKCMDAPDVRPTFEDSLRKLQLTYVDLYLIHAPFGVKKIVNSDGTEEERVCDIVETWRELERLVEEGKARSIGVSNFNSKQIDRICSNAKIKPVINQVECHVYLQQKSLQSFCHKYGVRLTGYATLGTAAFQETRTAKKILPLQDPLILELSAKYGRTPAQILLRNLIQRNIIVIPKSSSPERIAKNFEVFDFSITDEDMERIETLDQHHRICDFKQVVSPDHPEYPFHMPY